MPRRASWAGSSKTSASDSNLVSKGQCGNPVLEAGFLSLLKLLKSRPIEVRTATKESVDSGATRAVRPPMTVVVVPFSSPPVMVVIIPIRLRAAIAAMPVHEISVQCVRPALFPIGVATMNLQNECTLSRPACPWNVQSGVGVLAAHQTDRNKTNGCNDNHTSQKALASIVDLDKLLSAVMTPLHAVLSHCDMAGPRPGQLCLWPETSSWHRTI